MTKSIFDECIEKCGSMAELARRCGVSRQAIEGWKDLIPFARALDVEAATGIPRARLRPDIFRGPPLGGLSFDELLTELRRAVDAVGDDAICPRRGVQPTTEHGDDVIRRIVRLRTVAERALVEWRDTDKIQELIDRHKEEIGEIEDDLNDKISELEKDIRELKKQIKELKKNET